MNSAMIKYDPELHPNHGKPWKTVDVKYLIDFYGKDSLASISLALGRTYKTVADRVYVLKQQGKILIKPKRNKI